MYELSEDNSEINDAGAFTNSTVARDMEERGLMMNTTSDETLSPFRGAMTENNGEGGMRSSTMDS